MDTYQWTVITVLFVASLPAIVVKKGGDFPPFWQKESSFLAVMEELYERVRTKNKGIF